VRARVRRGADFAGVAFPFPDTRDGALATESAAPATAIPTSPDRARCCFVATLHEQLSAFDRALGRRVDCYHVRHLARGRHRRSLGPSLHPGGLPAISVTLPVVALFGYW
jgi:hypothetical protein